jgi:hypothetical protein
MSLTLIRRILFISFLTLIVVGLVLLSGFTFSNPTWRRYSSGVIDLNASSEQKGLAGELILGNDLNLLYTNERSTNPTCICNIQYEGTVPPAQCYVCVGYSESVNNYRIPDFVADGFIAESKNAQTLVVSQDRNYEQIQEMAAVANVINRPLWIYVRTNTHVEHEFIEIARSTGGDVVYYFRDIHYTDSFDPIAKILLIVGGSGIVLILGLEAWRWLHSQTPDDPDEGADAIDEVDDAVDVVDETENYMRRVERLSRKEIDKRNDSDRKR